jgi:hypothetical protein
MTLKFHRRLAHSAEGVVAAEMERDRINLQHVACHSAPPSFA